MCPLIVVYSVYLKGKKIIKNGKDKYPRKKFVKLLDFTDFTSFFGNLGQNWLEIHAEYNGYGHQK